MADLLLSRPKAQKTHTPKAAPAVQYDFANNYIDATTFPSALWRRHISQALRDKETLAGYGDPQGERLLRQVLSEYSHESRGVLCTPEQIVIGAGVQSLLEIITAVLQDNKPDTRAIALEEPGFPQAEEIFRRNGWKVSHFTTEAMPDDLPRLLYISPSNPYKGRSLTPEQRRHLLHWSREHDACILEDDYNGEFRYFSTPVTSLQGMSDGEHVIYLGSFSRLLLPSLRLSYAVLPVPLLPVYEQRFV